MHKGIVEKSNGAIAPKEVGTWTLPEIDLFLADPKEHTPTGNANLKTDWEAATELAAWARLTPLERLQNFQR